MEIVKRIIPAKPRSKELYFEKGGSSAIISGGGGSSGGGSSYWTLIDTDENDLPLENPYISTNYPIVTKVLPSENPEDPEAPVEPVSILNYLQIGGARLVYEDDALKVIKENGDPLSFYATGELSAYYLGGNENPENPDSTLFSISNATDVILTNPFTDDLLKYNGTHWVNVPMSSLVTEGTEYILPTASATTLGGVKVGNGLTISSGVLSVDVQSSDYSLPTASATTLGGVKIGTNVAISNGTISVHNPLTLGTSNGLSLSNQQLSLSLANTSSNGALSANDKVYIDLLRTLFEHDTTNNAIKALKPFYSVGEVSAYGLGGGIDISKLPSWTGYTSAMADYYVPASLLVSFRNDALSRLTTLEAGGGGGSGYVLPTATSNTLGGIKVGSNLSISSGVLSATNTTYGVATTSANGLMSSGDKTKLNGIATGANNYTHPSTHPASMITTGTFPGIVKAQNNTSYTTKQVRNIILSTDNAVSSQMANGDIWIKYE